MKRKNLLRAAVPAAVALLAPAITAVPAFAAAPAAPTVTQISGSATVGQMVTFKFTEPDGSQPVSYSWDIDGDELTGTATASHGQATVKIPALRFSNTLEVYSDGADGTFSDSAHFSFFAAGAAPYADQDLTGDGKPDLAVVVGDKLLEADGKGTAGKVRVPATTLSSDGNAISEDFTGYQVITGKFSGGSFEDYVAYNPSNGVAIAYSGLGALDKTHPRLLLTAGVSFGDFLSDIDGNNPIQLATAYDSSAQGNPIVDLVGIAGSATDGYHFEYYPAGFVTGAYPGPVDTGVATPDGGRDWQNWQLSSKLLPSGTAISLWNPATGALYLWEGVKFDVNSGQLTYTQFRVSAHFLAAATGTTLRLTDFNADGVPDVWAVTRAGVVTAYQISGLSTTGTAKIKAKGSPINLQ
ncbi:hypothetical protein [Actinoplanes subtropicus]|uniref:hypothetical protein n=1 Tax=Actinoplanes subtropicus TaxID=543632 RepID=UPI0004C2C4A5|nr:hypothetical protein [Actinoplanes subtropicus]